MDASHGLQFFIILLYGHNMHEKDNVNSKQKNDTAYLQRMNEMGFERFAASQPSIWMCNLSPEAEAEATILVPRNSFLVALWCFWGIEWRNESSLQRKQRD